MPDPAEFWTAPDNAPFGYRTWTPAAKPRARVIAFHGLGCRAEDFAPLGEALRIRGIELSAWNLRGQGLDPVVKRRGAWLEVEGMLADLAAFADFAARDGTPTFLCGESMGALIAMHAATTESWSKQIAGLLLLSPVIALAQKNPPWVKRLLHAVAAIAPGLRLRPGWFVHGSAAMPPLTRIPERQQYLTTAPHRLGQLTLRFLANMGDLIESAPTLAQRLTMPVAVFSAGHDVFVTPAQTREFFEQISSRDKTHFHYPESYHQTLFDLDAPQVLADAAAWLDARLPTNTSPQ